VPGTELASLAAADVPVVDCVASITYGAEYASVCASRWGPP